MAKKKKRSTIKIVSMDEMYRLINRVQMNKKEVKFALTPEDAIVGENVLSDIGLEYNKQEHKTKVSFTVYPNEEEEEEELDIDLDFYSDEIPEDGYIF